MVDDACWNSYLQRSEKLTLMKISSIIVFLIAIVSISSAQTTATRCPELKVFAPDHVYPGHLIRISAETLMKEPAKSNWLVVKENFESKKVDIERFSDVQSLEIQTWTTHENGSITAIASLGLSPQCEKERLASVTVNVVVNPGTPLILDEFGNLRWADKKGRMDYVVSEMEKRPEQELMIFLNFPKSYKGARKLEVIRGFFNHISVYRKFPAYRITFLVEDSDYFSARFQPTPQNLVHIHPGYFEIKAESLRDYERLFKH